MKIKAFIILITIDIIFGIIIALNLHSPVTMMTVFDYTTEDGKYNVQASCSEYNSDFVTISCSDLKTGVKVNYLKIRWLQNESGENNKYNINEIENGAKISFTDYSKKNVTYFIFWNDIFNDRLSS